MYILGGESHVFDSLFSLVISQTNVETKSEESPAAEKQPETFTKYEKKA